MADTTYSLRSSDNIVSHFGNEPSLVRDVGNIDDNTAHELMMHARVRSGDYLMTVAIELDRIGQNLAEEQSPYASEVERLVAELLYVNQRYTVEKKT